MFTAVEIEWLKAFLEKHVLQGEYKNYVAYTIDNVSNSYNSEQYDFMVLISDEEITQHGLSYATQGNYQLVKVDSSGASNNYQHSRYTVEQGTGVSIGVNTYNHIYTNIEGAMEPNIIAELEIANLNQYKNEILCNSLIVVLCITLLVKVLLSAFPMKMGD